jgi:hypothetical protein
LKLNLDPIASDDHVENLRGNKSPIGGFLPRGIFPPQRLTDERALRARGHILVLSEALAEHAAYFDAEATA